MNCMDKNKRDLKCIDEIKKKWWAYQSKNKNDRN